MVKSSLLKSIPSLLSGMLGSFFILFVFQWIKPTPHFGTVNITGLIDQFIKAETEKHISPEMLKNEVRYFGKELESTLKELSKEKHLVIFPSEAVIAGMKDYTSVVRATLNTNRDDHA